MKWSESGLEVINRILTFRPCWKFSTMKMIHLGERKAPKEFAPMPQTESHVMILWWRTYVIHYFYLHKENLVYDVASDTGGGGQSRLETGVARQHSPSWAVFTADEALSLGNSVHIPNIFIFTIGPGCTAWTQEPRRRADSFSARRGFSSSYFISWFVDLKDKMEDRVDCYTLGVFWCIYRCCLGSDSHKQGAAGY